MRTGLKIQDSKDLDRYLVQAQTRVIDAMEKLDRGGKGVAAVIDDAQRMVGIVTDGDIRRYILHGRDLNQPVSETMNRDFVYLSPEEVDKHREVMLWYGITAIPILAGDRTIQALYFLDEEIAKNANRNLEAPVVIMAGGKGTRLHPYTQVLPKPLIPVQGVPITMHIMNRFAAFGVRSFHMIVNYQKELIKAYYSDPNMPYRINFIDEESPLGTAGGLRLLLDEKAIDGSFFMTNCDILVQCDYAALYDFHRNRSNSITVVCALKKEVIPYGTILLDDQGYLEKIVEKPEHSYLINTGFYVIDPLALELVNQREVVGMPELMERCIAAGNKVGVYPVSERNWSDMGTIELLNKMEHDNLGFSSTR